MDARHFFAITLLKHQGPLSGVALREGLACNGCAVDDFWTMLGDMEAAGLIEGEKHEIIGGHYLKPTELGHKQWLEQYQANIPAAVEAAAVRPVDSRALKYYQEAIARMEESFEQE